MAYEIIERKRRDTKYKVNILKTGYFLFNAATTREKLSQFDFVEFYADKEADGKKIKVAVVPMKKETANTYALTKYKDNRAASVLGAVVLESIGYKNSKSYKTNGVWTQRKIKRADTWVLELEIDRKFCKAK